MRSFRYGLSLMSSLHPSYSFGPGHSVPSRDKTRTDALLVETLKSEPREKGIDTLPQYLDRRVLQESSKSTLVRTPCESFGFPGCVSY